MSVIGILRQLKTWFPLRIGVLPLRQYIQFVHLTLIRVGQSQIQRHCDYAENDEATHNRGHFRCPLRMRHCETYAEQKITRNHYKQA